MPCRQNVMLPASASVFKINQLADKSPAAAKLAYSQHQFIASFFERKINGIILWIHNAEKSGIAKALCAAAAVKNFAVKKDADIVTVTNVKLFHLIAIGRNHCPRIKDFHARLRLKPLGKIALECNAWMRSFAVTIKHNKARRFGFHILPLDGVGFSSCERAFKIARLSIISG